MSSQITVSNISQYLVDDQTFEELQASPDKQIEECFIHELRLNGLKDYVVVSDVIHLH